MSDREPLDIDETDDDADEPGAPELTPAQKRAATWAAKKAKAHAESTAAQPKAKRAESLVADNGTVTWPSIRDR